MAVPVDVFVADDSMSPAPIVGAVVGIVDNTTYAEVAQATTDVNGHASFMLPGAVAPGLTYQVRIFKLGVRFANPFDIQVEEPVVTTNKFDVSGTLITLFPAATDPRLCRCTGRFMNFSNQPIVGATVRIMAAGDLDDENPKVVDGNMISAEAMAFQTDQDGFLQIDLFQTGRYYITFSGNDDVIYKIKIPARSNVNLIDLIHPQPVSLTWDQTVAPGNAVTVAHGANVIVPFSILFSDYELESKNVNDWVVFSNNNPTAASVSAFNGNLSINGLTPGTSNITVAAASHLEPFRVPPYSVSAATLVVTVT